MLTFLSDYLSPINHSHALRILRFLWEDRGRKLSQILPYLICRQRLLENYYAWIMRG